MGRLTLLLLILTVVGCLSETKPQREIKFLPPPHTHKPKIKTDVWGQGVDVKVEQVECVRVHDPGSYRKRGAPIPFSFSCLARILVRNERDRPAGISSASAKGVNNSRVSVDLGKFFHPHPYFSELLIRPVVKGGVGCVLPGQAARGIIAFNTGIGRTIKERWSAPPEITFIQVTFYTGTGGCRKKQR